MARYRDCSPHPAHWTNRKLIDTLRQRAKFETCGFYLEPGYIGQGFPDPGNRDTDAIREATRLYRKTWIIPLIAVIESRLIKERK